MANNPNLYNAIIAGATGANQQRWLTSAVQADYTDFQAAVVALAGAVDDAIDPIDGDANAPQSALMQSIVQGVFADRFVQSGQQASYDAIVGPIVALWNELSESLEPPTETVSVPPLTNVLYVDAGSEATDPDGSIAAPFSSIPDAIASVEDPDFFVTLLLAPGVYEGQNVTDLSKSVSIVGLVAALGENQPSVIITDSTISIGALTFENCFIYNGADISANVGIEFNNCRIQGGSITALDGARVDVAMCDVLGGVWTDCDGEIDEYSHAWMREFVSPTVANAFNIRGGMGTVLGIEIEVPALGANELGYVDVDTTGTELDGITDAEQVLVTPRSDLAAAGANGGFCVGGRVSAANTVRVGFKGTLAGGLATFIITRTS